MENALKKSCSNTQLFLSKKFKFSLSTVNNALKPLEEIGAITKRQRGFEVVDIKKMLIYWASVRRLSKDILYKTNSNMKIMKIESSLPYGCIFTAFSAYRILYNDAPADYSEVYVYTDKKTIDEIKRRFPENNGPENLIVLEKDRFLNGKTTSLPQIYADLWNIKEWYAKDFINALGKRLNL